MNVATKVSAKANTYQAQLLGCEEELKQRWLVRLVLEDRIQTSLR